MALSQYLGAGQTLSEAVAARYAAIGQEQRRDFLTEWFTVRRQQTDELLNTLRSLLQLGYTLSSNYEENREINRLMEEEKRRGIIKSSGLLSDIFLTPTYKKFDEQKRTWKNIEKDDLYNIIMKKKYEKVESLLGDE